ncbi:uncharacterized protein A4U43_C01F32710 [Asparagus officinalis]|uniref:DUF789 family protein n=1 Tax=Asparagus officinalis TaxID=4686 RepID=A0A5P1FXE8_ASPOF|nr:uncharacterized protein LOC109831576 [Asparagus officinalis]ONK81771.1 uncharacterized protein A4U43_C01F32710 [Asparagus officinalis]
MLGTSLQFGRGNGDDRFYSAAKARRNHYRDHRNPPRSRTAGGGDQVMTGKSSEAETRVGFEEDMKKPEAIVSSLSSSSLTSSIESVGDRSSNLDRFLESTTPSIPAQYVSKTRMRGWRTCDVEYRPYFTLGDLWESFKEWSAYGAGVPLVLNGSDCVIQYYVPYLSGIQLYGDSSRQAGDSRQPGEDSDMDCYRDSSSDGSSDSELENGLKYARDWNRSHLSNGSTFGMDRLSMRENHGPMQEGFSSDDSDTGHSQGRLLFQYLERDPPYSREPLADKVSVLASKSPELKTLRSCDLLPASWISVAWYPIYRIPTGPTLKDLDACFLTFHSLATPTKGAGTASGPTVTYPQGVDGVPKISLPSFGLASYKFKGPLWTPTGGCEKQLASSLLQAADNWLQLHSVDHPDYRFFTSHGAFRR